MAVNSRTTLLAAGLTAIGASVCCIGPLVLVALGIGGGWIGTLGAVAPYRPIFVALTLGFLALAFHQLYIAPRTCTPDKPCAAPKVVGRQRLVFWSASVVLLALLVVPLLAPLVY